ncbi:MAG: alpha/beta hydrolase [Chitinophagales bacterium]|nr:alpha/beta hydrolase [Bacteroidota bacterium]MCB9074871.1 alpha/beta hydrolase [Chitinophagales bacterium]
MVRKLFILIVVSIVIIACKKENSTSKTPIVFVHGFLAAGDTYEKQVKRFASNGYSLDELYAFDYNTLDVINNPENSLDKFIDDVLAKTKARKINLVGHSRGAILVYDYCKKYEQSKKVENLVLLAGLKQGGAGGQSGNLPTLNIYSADDKIMTFGGDIRGVKNLRLFKKDHYEVATCEATFETIFQFLNKIKPSTLDIVEEDKIILSGKAVSFGENIPQAGTIVEVFEVNTNTGYRINSKPNAIFTTDAAGHWGDFEAKKSTHYEFVVYNPSVPKNRKVHYYREPFLRSDQLVYLRSFPEDGSLASMFLASLPQDDDKSVVAFFGASQSVVSGRDVLKVNGYNYSNNIFATESNTTIALFMYDDNKNNRTDNSSIPSFALFPFLKGADVYFQTQTPETILFELNGRKIPVYNWKSKTEGVGVAVFE